ncbi:MAG: DUF2163 domain-containing protein [Pseudomonadota bacterium]
MTTLIEAADTQHTTCQCWRLTRTDGATLCVTEHDRPLQIDGQLYTPGLVLEASAYEETESLAAGRAEVSGAIDHDAIDTADLAAGLWDGAHINVFRADWATATHKHHIWSGRLGEISENDGRFTVALTSQKSDLSAMLGRAYTRQCDATLGGQGCCVDLTNPDLAGAVCDKTFETCATVFGNAVNFRGFPHMPGADFMLAGPGRGSSE